MTERTDPAPLADMSWLPWAVYILIVAILTLWWAWPKITARRGRRRRVTPGPQATTFARRVAGDRAVDHQHEHPVIELFAPRVRAAAIADWSMARNDDPTGSVDLTRWPASQAEIAVAARHLATGLAWVELVSVCGSVERALAVEAATGELCRRDRAAAGRYLWVVPQ